MISLDKVEEMQRIVLTCPAWSFPGQFSQSQVEDVQRHAYLLNECLNGSTLKLLNGSSKEYPEFLAQFCGPSGVKIFDPDRDFDFMPEVYTSGILFLSPEEVEEAVPHILFKVLRKNLRFNVLTPANSIVIDRVNGTATCIAA